MALSSFVLSADAQVGWVVLVERGGLRYLEVLAWVNGATVGVKQFKALVMGRTDMNKDQADRITNKPDLYVVAKGGRATGVRAPGG